MILALAFVDDLRTALRGIGRLPDELALLREKFSLDVLRAAGQQGAVNGALVTAIVLVVLYLLSRVRK